MPVTKIRQEQLRDIGGLTREKITQASHGFSVGEALYFNGTVWAKALADSADTAEFLGLVEEIKGDTFTIVYQGKIKNLSGLTPGAVYFLSASVAGGITTVVPSSGNVNKPLLVARSSTEGVVVNWRGIVSGSGGGSVGTDAAEMYKTTIGDGSSVNFDITPGMDTSAVIVQLYETSTGKVIGGPEEIIVGYNSNTQVRIEFPVGSPPTTNQYTVVIVGS